MIAPTLAMAQVEKRVEVSKTYIPSVGNASKLAIQPNMNDTVRLHPDIDYTITPLSIETALATKPIKPATVTYWEFDRPKPLYVKVGFGLPLNSVIDIYASTQNSGTGYVVGYFNHLGQFAKIQNDWGVKNKSDMMLNRVGVAAGKYFGKQTLSAQISYEDQLHHRYGIYSQPTAPVGALTPGSESNFGRFDAKVNFGDDFLYEDNINYNVGVDFGHFGDNSTWAETSNPSEFSFGADAIAAMRLNHSNRLTLQVEYDHMQSTNSDYNFKRNLIGFGGVYSFVNDRIDLDAGLIYYHESTDGVDLHNRIASHVIPQIDLEVNLGTEKFIPILQWDGEVRANSMGEIMAQNPYITAPTYIDYSSVDLSLRLGAKGALASKLNYFAFAEYGVQNEFLHWAFLVDESSVASSAVAPAVGFVPLIGDQTYLAANFELDYRPSQRFQALASLRLLKYSSDEIYSNGMPNIEASAELNYTIKRFIFGLGAKLQSSRQWQSVALPTAQPAMYEVGTTVDLSLSAEWRMKDNLSFFAEGNNLANMELYALPFYAGYGANFTVGAKILF